MIPEIINIYGEDYNIRVVAHEELDSAAHIDFEKKLIRIRQDSEEEMLWGFLHECFHGVFEEARTNESLDEKLEEIVIEQVVKFLLKHFTVKPK